LASWNLASEMMQRNYRKLQQGFSCCQVAGWLVLAPLPAPATSLPEHLPSFVEKPLKPSCHVITQVNRKEKTAFHGPTK